MTSHEEVHASLDDEPAQVVSGTPASTLADSGGVLAPLSQGPTSKESEHGHDEKILDCEKAETDKQDNDDEFYVSPAVFLTSPSQLKKRAG